LPPALPPDPGLRREEVAQLSGGRDWYTWLEQPPDQRQPAALGAVARTRC
jgi:hypothetical protein